MVEKQTKGILNPSYLIGEKDSGGIKTGYLTAG